MLTQQDSLEKMPEQLCLIIMRGENQQEWNMKEPLEVLECRIGLREEYDRNMRHMT